MLRKINPMRFTLLLILSILAITVSAQELILPDSPKLVIHEMEDQLILTVSNDPLSNNHQESYSAKDSTLLNYFPGLPDVEYEFQGYQIFQVATSSVRAEDLQNPNLAREVAQCDLVDGVENIHNIFYDSSLNMSIPSLMVEGSNNGIRHSFLITEDAFSLDDAGLINFRSYYFIAVAYAFVKLPYTTELYPTGTFKQYIYSSSGASGELAPVMGIPHKRQLENNGTHLQAQYGDGPEITQLDGNGNGGNGLELTDESLATIVSEGFDLTPTYKVGAGPILVKVVDPMKVKGGSYLCKLHSYTPSFKNGADSAQWTIYQYDYLGGTILDSVTSENAIWKKNEQIIEDWGVSVEITQAFYTPPSSGPYSNERWSSTPISATMQYDDETEQWLEFIHDTEAMTITNWIRSGDFQVIDPWGFEEWNCFNDDIGIDPKGEWADLYDGGMAPFRLTRNECPTMPVAFYNYSSGNSARYRSSLSYLPSVDIVFTTDKSKWTRCPVIELGRDDNLSVGHVDAGTLRGSKSVDKYGKADKSGTTGMGWFPGYAIDVESGVRLYMAFGENSFMGLDNGNDMIWNPSERLWSGANQPLLGGMHAIWVMSYKNKTKNNDLLAYDYPAYIPSEAEDLATNALYQDFLLIEGNNNFAKRNVYSSISWIINPLLAKNETILSTDLTLKVRVSKEYKNAISTGWNNGQPLYSWNMDELKSTENSPRVLAEAMACINVFPNPSMLQEPPFHDKVQLINLPEQCQITIVDPKGTYVRSFSKNDAFTSLDWDLRNFNGVAVASGVYLIHVSVPGIGERTLLSSIVR
jgi:hypothetical protein